MGWEFQCTKCGQEIVVKFSKPGDMVKCINCNSEVVVPNSAVTTDKEPDYSKMTFGNAKMQSDILLNKGVLLKDLFRGIDRCVAVVFFVIALFTTVVLFSFFNTYLAEMTVAFILVSTYETVFVIILIASGIGLWTGKKWGKRLGILACITRILLPLTIVFMVLAAIMAIYLFASIIVGNKGIRKKINSSYCPHTL